MLGKGRPGGVYPKSLKAVAGALGATPERLLRGELASESEGLPKYIKPVFSSAAAAAWLDDRAASGRASRIAIIVPTFKHLLHVVEALNELPASVRPTWHPVSRRLTWPAGSKATAITGPVDLDLSWLAKSFKGPVVDVLWFEGLELRQMPLPALEALRAQLGDPAVLWTLPSPLPG